MRLGRAKLEKAEESAKMDKERAKTDDERDGGAGTE